jgi:hypothetical protein
MSVVIDGVILLGVILTLVVLLNAFLINVMAPLKVLLVFWKPLWQFN